LGFAAFDFAALCDAVRVLPLFPGFANDGVAHAKSAAITSTEQDLVFNLPFSRRPLTLIRSSGQV
jgi:hypothetical protein